MPSFCSPLNFAWLPASREPTCQKTNERELSEASWKRAPPSEYNRRDRVGFVSGPPIHEPETETVNTPQTDAGADTTRREFGKALAALAAVPLVPVLEVGAAEKEPSAAVAE